MSISDGENTIVYLYNVRGYYSESLLTAECLKMRYYDDATTEVGNLRFPYDPRA